MHEENITILAYMHQTLEPKIYEANIIELKGEIDIQ